MKKVLAILFAVCFLAAGAGAQILPSADPEADSIAFNRVKARLDSIRQYRPTVVLVLAGGGARGLAHLGVIRYMEELGIPVDAVVGTSMGGLLSGLYSLGYDHKQLDTIVRNVDWPVMMSDKIPDAYLTYRLRKSRERFAITVPFHYDNEDLQAKKSKEMADQIDRFAAEAGVSTSDVLQEAVSRMGIGMPDGLLFGINIRNLISSVSVGYQDNIEFSSLPRPYTCVATDMYTLKPKYWTDGNISDAIRSTIAIPFYFRAVRTSGEVLLDGGMRNNYPVDVARQLGADIVVGSEMSTRRGLDELNNPVEIVLQTINLLGSGTLDQNLTSSDLNVHHDLSSFNMMSFDEASVNGILEEGYETALQHKEEFEALAARFKDIAPVPFSPPKPAVNIALTKVKVEDVRFDGLTPQEQSHIINSLLYPSDGMYGKKEIETLLNYIYGTNAFESVTYRLEGRQEPYTLVFECQKGQVNEIAASVHADTDEYVYAGARIGIGTRRLYGPRFTADIKLGGNPSIALDAAYRPMIGIPSFGVVLRGNLMNTELSSESGPTFDRLFSTGVDAYIEDSRMTYGSLRAGVSYEMAPFERSLTIDYYTNAWDWKSYWMSAFANIRVDTFNDGYFPTMGVKFTYDARYVFNSYYDYLDFFGILPGGRVPGYATMSGSFSAAISPVPEFTIQPTIYAGWNTIESNLMNPRHLFAIGGTLPGRYVEHQVPFFGMASGYRASSGFGAVGQLDLRYCLARKNFLTLRGGALADFADWDELTLAPFIEWAVGAEYARQTIVGPLKIAAQWCNTMRFSVFATIGFDF